MHLLEMGATHSPLIRQPHRLSSRPAIHRVSHSNPPSITELPRRRISVRKPSTMQTPRARIRRQ
jgi:hypothetical protein